MNKMEVVKEMMNSNNGGLYAAIGGIVLVYGIDRIVESRYRMEAKKDSLTIEPATMHENTAPPSMKENASKPVAKKAPAKKTKA